LKTIAVIPARYAATRFPGKLMAQLGRKTVIRTTYENTVNTGLFDDVFVATDSQIIYNEIISHGGKAIISKNTHQCGSDRIAEAVKDLDCEIIINVQGDEPFINKTPLEKLIKVYKADIKKEIAMGTLIQKIADESNIENPNCVKVAVDRNNFALYFSRSAIPYSSQGIPSKYYKHIGVYAFRKEALLKFAKLPMLQNEKAEKLEQLRFLEYGMKVKVVETSFVGIEIDIPEDLVKANAYLRKQW